MPTVRENDTIVLTYTGMLDNGEVFASADASQPLTITLGQSELPPTVENALAGMQPGESRKVRVAPEEGYGPRQKDLLQTISRSNLPATINPKPGMILGLSVTRDGVAIKVPATVMEISGDQLVVDYNHPLAGHHLTYQLHLLQILTSN